MKAHHLPSALRCPACAANLDGALNTTSDDLPKDGDAALRSACRALLVYSGTPTNSLRYPTAEEQRKFLADPDVQTAIRALAALHRDRGIRR